MAGGDVGLTGEQEWEVERLVVRSSRREGGGEEEV
tara:strand:- start:123 stop:227 length:105 start_codon:yes stop_codon:yes gene_type:complete